MLLQALAHGVPHAVQFRQTNHISSLRAPVRLAGRLRYAPPATLVMQETTPRAVTYRIVGARLFIGDRRRSVPLAQFPQLLAMVASFIGLLSGNGALLTHDYHLQLHGTPRAWQLRLQPRLADLARVVTMVTVRGHDGVLTTVTTRAANGNYSVIHLTP
ncbi:MAG: LolA-related protein [Acidiferrobacter sp.]